MKQKALILSPWATDDGNYMQIKKDHAISYWQDVTGQSTANISPNPNALVVYIEAEDTVMAQIVADDNYPVLEGYPIDIVEEVI